MSLEQQQLAETSLSLNQDFFTRYPARSARHLARIPAIEGAELLQSQAPGVVMALWRFLPAGTADSIFVHFPLDFALTLITRLDTHIAIALLSRLPMDTRTALMARLAQSEPGLAQEFTELLGYPEDTAARLMTTRVNVFYDELSVADALRQLRQRKLPGQEVIYVQDSNLALVGEIGLAQLLAADAGEQLGVIAEPLKAVLNALDSKERVIEVFEGHRCSAIPVLDLHEQILGVIHFFDVYQSTKEDLTSDMQTMVGASKEERALSSSWFAVRKRQPWLQINLLTAFAAAVVGSFEGLISQITALAILLPVAAGQSGNAGAQALAVTMRGLTLREISTRHWLRVLLKELFAGLLNGLAIAVTCSIAVYFWSHSFGLALVIAIAMVLSLAIACSAGAIVPIMLKKFGLDPAQSSSIVLTTITDIAGFLSFLGIALLLSDMLPRG
ncbi:magnesium transporter [Shewanella salipaludis]|uniref:Magnesium transporter n=1 Tax=Shewanella salipaludis TaxID=2723052 RepID=A0A972JLR6_9GAMM|nr:magnesium transporter [Shewanella salipaludis]NMH64356.1 magnesium transporter [Shewanella salipaludis]